jgi:peptide/nickel transport system substrate-binding protein
VNRRFVIAVTSLVLLASACTGDSGGKAHPRAGASAYPRGGTLRVAAEHYTFDPQVSYAAADWEVLRCCLLRTLFTYNGQTTEEGGSVLRPDLSSNMGSVSPDGLTWTFTLKRGIRYAPPFQDAVITAADIARALERTGNLQSGYHNYYSIIDGFDTFEAGQVDSISGITVPTDRTLIVRLTHPSGDLPYLFAMPATSPIPEGASEGHDEDYERFLVSSGPYMFEGSGDLDFSVPPAEQQPASGYQPDEGSALLVRNPSWDPATDPVRGAYVDRIQLSLHEGEDESGRRRRAAGIEHTRFDLLLDDFGLSINLEDAQRYRADPSLVGGLLTGQQNSLGSIDMDLAMPPFDDLDVRRAVMYAIDREAIVAGAGVAFIGSAELPAHLAPDSMEGGLLSSYDPYPDHRGNIEAARRAMAASKYDHDADGICDDPVCADVTLGGAVVGLPRRDDEAFLVQRSLRAIGIRARVELTPDPGAAFKRGRIAMDVEVSNQWFADYPNGTQFFTPLYASGAIDACCNSTLVGASADQLRALGRDPVPVPSVDDRIDACQISTGIEQTRCWAQLDQFMMEQVVPVVPILIPGIQTPYSTRVLHASIDQWTADPALDQVALELGSD